MFPQQKNSYLQSVHANVNPRLLNRCVAQARKQREGDMMDVSPALNRLTSQQPPIPLEQEFDPTKRILPFGRMGLPILIRDLQHPDSQIVLRTLSTLNDLLRNPEKAYEALRLKLPDRLLTVLPREEQFIRERCCLSYQLMANYLDGKTAMVENPKILQSFLKLIKDEKPEVRLKTANCLERIASFWMTADNLVDAGFIKPIMDRIGVDDSTITVVHLQTLAHLMYGNGNNIAMEAGAFDLMVNLLECSEVEIREAALNCLLVMTSTELGKQMAVKCDLLSILAKLLFEDERLLLTTTSVMIFCTMLTEAKVAAAQLKSIPTRLVRLCQNHLNPTLQLFCFKALTNLAEHPDVRRMLRAKHLGRLTKIHVATKNLEKHKKILLEVIAWEPSQLVCTFGNQE